MIKVSDYIVKKLENYGIHHVFMVSGGGAMHLDDSFGKSKKIQYVCNHNEQACAIAAEGYARVRQQLGVVCVTTGPGGINCLNGVFGQWTDSVPVLYISGQVKFSTTLASCPDIPLRQLGDQEADITAIVKPITKYAHMVTDPYEIDEVLDRAIFEATTGRPGPVWVDVPMNVQAALIDESKLKKKTFEFVRPTAYKQDLPFIVSKLKTARRPLLVAGHGIRITRAEKEFKELLEELQIPAVATYNGFDVLPTHSPYYAGRIGTSGTRAGNFALQNADLVLFLGTRNNIRQASYNYENFAKNAFKIIVDIDEAELKKPTVKPDLAVHADLRDFLTDLNIRDIGPLDKRDWLAWCQERVKKYPPLREFELKETGPVNAYQFLTTLTKELSSNALLVGTNGTCCLGLLQTAVVKEGQRMFLNSGNASMGYGLPAAIGACLANYKRKTVCLEGDGSIMMNLQELQTVAHENLPLKIFIINNNGYISIRQTQNNFFNGHFTACSPESGVTLPDFVKIAQAFGLKTIRIESPDELESKIFDVLRQPGPVVCEVMCETDYTFKPKLSARKLDDGTMVSPTLEDMAPFLSREELASNMLPPLEKDTSKPVLEP